MPLCCYYTKSFFTSFLCYLQLFGRVYDLLSFDCPNQKLVECMVITAEMFGYISFNFPITNKDISKEISQNKELIMKINNSFHVLPYILLIRIHSIKILCINITDNEKTIREGISNNIKKLIMVTMSVQRDLNFANT